TKKHHEDETEQREGEKKTKYLNNGTELQVLMEGETGGEELTAEREAMKDLDKKKTKHEEELQKKEGERKNTKEEVARLMVRKTELEDLRKKLKLQLKEVETQIEGKEKELRLPVTTGQYQVIGSPQPIVALAGGDVILPCCLEPAISAVTRTVEWSRTDLNPEYIHLHQNGLLIIQEQNPLYKNRTGLFLDELRNGNVSLKLSRVKLSDEGKYRCFIPSIWSGAIIQLTVGLSQVIDQSQPIVAIVGDDIILPCHLEPAMDAVAMALEWARPDLEPRFVHVWRDGQDLLINKHPSYEGRTRLFIDKLKHGDISLKLSKVKLSDEGRYRCFIPSLGRESIVKLVVGAVSSPVIGITKASSEVVLGCESKGWYPEPEVFWLDGEGNILSAGPTETVRGPDGLYTVSSRVTVEKTDTFTCRVQQQSINQSRERQIHIPIPFIISDVPFPAAVYITIVLAVVFMCIVAVVFLVWRWRRNKISK
uniref:butyrophilin subfamily 1 member A1-like n=1 Tax=Centroberyx gerrardi TaxID=166262 RepID=UPI003AAB4B47